MVQARKLAACLLFMILLSACGRKPDPALSVYATAYTILTQTASKVTQPPTQTTAPAQPTATLALATATFTPPGAIQPVEPSPVAPSAQAPANPTPLSQSLPTPTLALVLPTQNTAFTMTNTPIAASETPTATPFLSGPTSTPTLPPPEQGMLGYWQQDHTGGVIQFDVDGNYRLSDSYAALSAGLADTGSYVLQNDQLTMIGAAGSATCRGLSGTYKVEIPATGQRKLISIQDLCFERQQIMAKGGWYWLPLATNAQPASPEAEETPVQVIPLVGPLGKPESRISGMAWVNDLLVILPADPSFMGDSNSPALFAIPEGDILGFLSGINTSGVYPFQIAFDDSGLSTQLSGFRGYQALAYSGGRFYFIVEADTANGRRNYLVSGVMQSDLSSIVLDASKVVEIPSQSGANTFRTLLIIGAELVAIPQSNQLAGTPSAQRFDLSLNYLGSALFPVLDYLTTDASGLNSDNHFWVINRYAPGDPMPMTVPDSLAQRYGEGVTHQLSDITERLVEIAWTASSTTPEMSLVNQSPLQLELWMKGARNWQALVRLEGRGLLIATSQSPETILGFIPLQ